MFVQALHRRIAPEPCNGSAPLPQRYSNCPCAPSPGKRIPGCEKIPPCLPRTRRDDWRDRPLPSGPFLHIEPGVSPRPHARSLTAPSRLALLQKRSYAFAKIGSLTNGGILCDRFFGLAVEDVTNEIIDEPLG